ASGGIDATARVVLTLAGIAAAALILVPLSVLLFSAFRRPPDFLPFESGARWSLENVQRLYTRTALFQRLLPDTLVSVAGTLVLTTAWAFAIAWLLERTDLPGRNLAYLLVLLPLLIPT